MNDVGRADLGAQVFMKSLAQFCEFTVEVHGGCGNEGQSKQSREDLAGVAIGEFDLMTKKHGRGFGDGTDQGIAKFAGRGLEDGTAAVGAESGIVDEIGDQGFGLKNNVLLTGGLRFR